MSNPSPARRKIAVIDCGTNTFALNIYETSDGRTFQRVYKERYFVELLEDGRDFIGAAPYQRALSAHYNFAQTLLKHDIHRLRAFGTAALRMASNGAQLMQEIHESTGIEIELIDGMREAELIYRGVRLAAPDTGSTMLIMDIGGGSVEFILCNKQEIFWAQSFNIGAAVLYDMFRPSDPIEASTIEDMHQRLSELLAPLWEASLRFPAAVLVGASGTFDVIAAMHNPTRRRHAKPYEPIPSAFFLNEVYARLIHSSYDERLKMHDLPHTRAKLIVGVVVLIRLVIERLNLPVLAISDYALREGAAWEILHTEK